MQVVGARGKVLGAGESLRGKGPVADFNRVEPDEPREDDGDDTGGDGDKDDDSDGSGDGSDDDKGESGEDDADG